MPARIALTLFTLLVTINCAHLSASTNALDPLSEQEIRTAVEVLRGSGKITRNALFPTISLQEPDKTLTGRTPRTASIVVFERAANRTSIAWVDVETRKLTSWREVPGAQAPMTAADSIVADRVVRNDPRWQKAIAGRGLRQSDVGVAIWTPGFFALTHETGVRLGMGVTYRANAGSYDMYELPVEGILAIVDITNQKVVSFRDSGPVPNSPAVRPSNPRPALKPLRITQPEGVSFAIDGQEVRWEKWRFRWSVNAREGLVLHTVGYEDGGRLRSILYRAAVSEMLVPYGDPDPAWFFRSAFDAGELGLGTALSSLRSGVDCPQNCTLLPVVLADDFGRPRRIDSGVALYERDGGIAWKHGAITRRARELVIGIMVQAGNYDYGFEWIFRQDGSLEARVTMTGIMAVKGVQGHDHYGHLVAKNLAAIHHQHFFNYRLDFDVDGTANRLIEMDTEPDPVSAANRYGTAFHMKETVLKTEKDAQRTVDVRASRRWLIESTTRKNSLGAPTGYLILPVENAFPFTAPESWIRRRASFVNFHLWGTPYAANELYSAGEFPNQSRATEGLRIWTAKNRPIDGKDLVVWYTLGMTHIPRPEEWPVMPSQTSGFKLVPANFFDRNPALDLPETVR